MSTQEQPITASLVTGAQRLDFLPTFFGPRLMMRGELLVYAWLSGLSKDYKGGCWNYYTLTNGGFYMAPATDKAMRLVVAGNWFDGVLSADAAGIVATLFALCQLTSEAGHTDAGASLADRYHFLRDFVASHPEAAAIYRAID